MRVACEVPELIPAARANSSVVHILAHRKRRAGLSLQDPGKLPVADNATRPGFAAFAEWYFVYQDQNEQMRSMEIGASVIAAVVVGIRQYVSKRRSVILRARK